MGRPQYQSPVFTTEQEVFLSDRWGNLGRNITELVESVDFDIDIDRPASKMDATITTYREVIEDGDWVSVFQRIIPETGEIQYDQRGHVRASTPSIEISGQGEVRTVARCSDILEELDQVLLDRAFVTPVGGFIMEDVRYLIKYGSMGMIGANILNNPGFEDGFTDWPTSATQSGTIGSDLIPEYEPAEGEKYIWAMFDAGAAVGQQIAQSSTSVPVLPVWIGNQRMWGSASFYRRSIHDVIFYIRFFDSGGNAIYPAGFGFDYIASPVRRNSGWERVFFWTESIPKNAASVGIVIGAKVRETSSGASRTIFDQAFLGTAIGTPLPDDRIVLPDEGRKATEAIAHKAGDSVLAAINDRLEAIGYHPLFTTLDGKITTRKISEMTVGEPVRHYEAEKDIRFSDILLIEPSAENRYNRVIAIKENTDGEPPTVAIAENTNSADPWSLYQSAQRATTITSQDAETYEDLLAVAEAELEKSSMQEELRFRIVPDTDLALYDIIAVHGYEDDRSTGLWMIKSIRYGLSELDPTMEVVARRTFKRLT